MSNSTEGGISLGTVLAAIISWNLNHSVLWALIHAIFGWFYVIYAALEYDL